MKVIECVFESRIRGMVIVDDMQFGLWRGNGTDAIFTVRQVQEKGVNKRRNSLCFVYALKKAFDRIPSG